MKLKQSTLDAIKHLGEINRGLIIHEGKQLRTQDNLNKAIAYIDIEDEFPRTFGVYDVEEFLKSIKLVHDAELTFEDTHVLITNKEGIELVYQYADTDFVTEAPEKVNFPYVDPQSHDEDFINFSIDYDGIEQVIKACKTLGLGHIRFYSESESETIYISAYDKSGSKKHTFKIPLDKFDSKRVVEAVFHLDRLTILAKGDYSVSIHTAGISQFKSDTHTYYLATEAV
ncbi:TPA: hypothetical protein GRI77_19760 [Vibrio parahaemolyticus]|uniref:hypothetical protein n=1 Tax=Vibrio parahaemolyticus TaxID=670 RepID=UPI0007A07AD7|nr:hypothetical protein [Vibrio parahaemolyticus]EGQ9353239.1 hypothetical protein [Vibrio parahaemolyticus]EGQ9515707.1 hypothetical protein [Vibrio parahaemolyticus]EIM7931144.1 hypothetical protein [Vibrio parahaemolyticus]EJQ8019139.1 hypothetical protein [Vibrio parahaemolyticus]EJU8977734.1 hypothetical protein [Vibrio parahaemolyticus]